MLWEGKGRATPYYLTVFSFSFQNTFFSIYLLHSFSRITDLAVNFSDIAGYAHRSKSIFNLRIHKLYYLLLELVNYWKLWMQSNMTGKLKQSLVLQQQHCQQIGCLCDFIFGKFYFFIVMMISKLYSLQIYH